MKSLEMTSMLNNGEMIQFHLNTVDAVMSVYIHEVMPCSFGGVLV